MAKIDYKWLTNPRPNPGEELTWKQLTDWMASTGYVEGLVRKHISPLDRRLIEDYTQDIWLQILSIPHDKLLDIYHRGKGSFTNYIKAIVNNNVRSTCSLVYTRIKSKYKGELYLDDIGWSQLDQRQPADAVDLMVASEPGKAWFEPIPIQVNIEKDYED